MTTQFVTSLFALFLALSGCATSEKSILLGSTIGVGVGAGIGSTTNGSHGGAIGALIGAGLGGLLGYQSYKDKQKKMEAEGNNLPPIPYSMSSSGENSGSRPRLKPAQVRAKFVKDQIKDGIFIPAHLEYEITSPAKWEGSK